MYNTLMIIYLGPRYLVIPNAYFTLSKSDPNNFPVVGNRIFKWNNNRTTNSALLRNKKKMQHHLTPTVCFSMSLKSKVLSTKTMDPIWNEIIWITSKSTTSYKPMSQIQITIIKTSVFLKNKYCLYLSVLLQNS